MSYQIYPIVLAAAVLSGPALAQAAAPVTDTVAVDDASATRAGSTISGTVKNQVRGASPVTINEGGIRAAPASCSNRERASARVAPITVQEEGIRSAPITIDEEGVRPASVTLHEEGVRSASITVNEEGVRATANKPVGRAAPITIQEEGVRSAPVTIKEEGVRSASAAAKLAESCGPAG